MTKFDRVGKGVGMLFGNGRSHIYASGSGGICPPAVVSPSTRSRGRACNLAQQGLGESLETFAGGSNTTQSSEASDYNSCDSDSDSFVVQYDALLASPSSSRLATSGYNDYDVSRTRFSTALTDDSHESDSSGGAPESGAPAVKRGRVFDPKESQSRSRRDTIFDTFVLSGQVAPISRSQGPWQDGYKKLVKSTRHEPNSVFSARSKSGDNVREYLLEYQSQCIKAPPLEPLRLRGLIPARTSQIEESKPMIADIESKENDIERKESGIESKESGTKDHDIESKVNDSSIDSGLSNLFKDVEAPYTTPTASSDAKTDLASDTVAPNGKLVAKPGHVWTKASESPNRQGVFIGSILLKDYGVVLPSSSRRKSGSQGFIALRMCISVPFSIGEERSHFDGDDDEDEKDYTLTVIDEHEEEVVLNPFELDYVMDPVHQTTPEIEPATTDTVEDHKYDTENGQHDVWADPLEYIYFMSADHSTTIQSADEGNDTSCVFNRLFDTVVSSASLLLSPGVREQLSIFMRVESSRDSLRRLCGPFWPDQVDSPCLRQPHVRERAEC
ncbi:hypothetical protein RhiJN_03602 [Ceratobasidium sp. AG-Ba]|nr:hypothetical protein RhiJN_03602 [Ceratobasidium sp. AG-Ba]QRW04497.1 hypothetical protein RhiLY_03496 [Ceratobasidium sp. AG-Ba]